MAKNMKVVLENKGTALLNDNNYVASGGEGTIYKVSDQIVKIYHEPLIARQRGMPDKIRLLSALKHPYVSSPIGLVLSSTGEPIGHYLNYVDGHPLARVFTNDFWTREGFTEKNASTLVDRMREVFSFAHQHKAILVDANELNWFMVFSNHNPEPRVIDVDSWSIGRWPATVIMPSIRDWHSKEFNEKSDWFTWGIVTFQIYTGTHPYKGTLDGFDRSNLEGRMKANASVFTKGVRLNRAVRDFSKIPGPLLNWYEATFQNGERVKPPSAFDTGIVMPKTAIVTRIVMTGGSGNLVFEKLLNIDGDPTLRIFNCGIAQLASGKLIDLSNKRKIGEVKTRQCEVVKVDGGWLIGELSNGKVSLEYVEEGSLKSESLSFSLNGHKLQGYNNRLFVVTDSGLTEIKLHLFGKPVVSAGQTWGVMINSTKWFHGLGVMDAMGAKFVVVPFGDDAVVQQRVKEIDNLKIISAKSGDRFVSLVGLDKTGTYHKVSIAFARDYKSYNVSTVIVDGPELNLAILPKGVCASIDKDGELEIFVPSNGKVTQIGNKNITTDMLLSNWGDRVVYIQDGAVWSLRMK